LVSFAPTLGALAHPFLLGDTVARFWLQRNFSAQAAPIEAGVRRDWQCSKPASLRLVRCFRSF